MGILANGGKLGKETLLSSKAIQHLYTPLTSEFDRVVLRRITYGPGTTLFTIKHDGQSVLHSISTFCWSCLLHFVYFVMCIHFFIHSGNFYRASSSPLLLRGAPDTAQILCRSFKKDLPKVPMWWLERDSNLRPFGRKANGMWLISNLGYICCTLYEKITFLGPLLSCTPYILWAPSPIRTYE